MSECCTHTLDSYIPIRKFTCSSLSPHIYVSSCRTFVTLLQFWFVRHASGRRPLRTLSLDIWITIDSLLILLPISLSLSAKCLFLLPLCCDYVDHFFLVLIVVIVSFSLPVCLQILWSRKCFTTYCEPVLAVCIRVEVANRESVVVLTSTRTIR